MPICWPNEVRNMYGLPSVVSSAASPPTNCGICVSFTISRVTLTLPERIGPKIMYGSPSMAFCICARATPGLVCVSYKVSASFCLRTPPFALISSTARITPSRKLPPDGASGPDISPTYATFTWASAAPDRSANVTSTPTRLNRLMPSSPIHEQILYHCIDPLLALGRAGMGAAYGRRHDLVRDVKVPDRGAAACRELHHELRQVVQIPDRL